MPITQVQSPDGNMIKVEHPEGASQQEIIAYAQQNYKPKPQERKFNEARVSNVGNVIDRVRRGEQSQFGGGLAVLGEGLGQQGEDIFNFVARNTPQPIKQGLGYLAGQASNLGSGIGEALPAGGQDFITNRTNEISSGINYLNKKYPVTMSELKGVANIGNTILAGIPFGGAAVKSADLAGTGLQYAGRGIKQSGENIKREFVKDLVMPVQTKKVLEEQASRTTEKGLLKTKVVKPTPLEAASIEEVAQIKGIKKGNSAQANYTLIEKAKDTEAQRLGSILKSKDFQINKPMYQQKLSAVVNKLKTDDPFILGNDAAEKLVDNVANKMQALLDKNPNTPAGLLKTRQEFDAWAKSKKRGVFEGNEETFSNAVRDIRQSANDFLAESVPDAAVKESLRKQSLLFRALDNVEPKTAIEGRNRLQRAAKSASDAIPVKNPMVKGALQLGGLGALGAGTYFAPAAAALAGGAYGVGKIANSPAVRNALGSLTELTGTALRGGKSLTPKQALGALNEVKPRIRVKAGSSNK